MLKKRKRELEYEYEEDFDDEEEEGMDFLEIFMMVRRHVKAIIAITILTTLLGGFFAFTRVDKYKAATTLIVSSGNYYSSKNLDSNELSLNQKLATTYTAVAKSPSLLNAIIKRLDLDLDIKGLSEVIEVSSVEDTELIKITVTDTDPVMAMRIANETAVEFAGKIKEVMTFENIKVVEEAEVPQEPESSKRALIVAVSFLIGMLMGTFLVILVEMFHSKLRRPKDIEKILGASILTHIPVYEQIDELEVLHQKSKLKSVLKIGEFGKGGK